MWSPNNARGIVYLAILLVLVSMLLMATGTTVGHLSRNVIPENYNLEIITYLYDDDNIQSFFEGKVIIMVKCLVSTSIIFLNVLDLKIHNGVSLIRTGGKPHSVYVKEWCLYPKNETMGIKLNKPLTPGDIYNLTIRFTGNIANNFEGYQKVLSSQWSSDNKLSYSPLAFTHFEPTDARRAFPCFDEPNFKATFEISLGRLEKYHSLSNMPLAKTEPMEKKKGWFWDRFQKTVRMTTYLAAFVVSDYEAIIAPKVSSNNVTFQIWGEKHTMDFMNWAADVGPKALEFFEQYLSIKYVLPKVDMLYVNFFTSGAMENWGLIIYKQDALLVTSDTTYVQRTGITNTICHELAHQWFGNLVTMKWWNDLWLNEGFATFFAAFVVHRLYPEWNSFDEEIVKQIDLVFHYDCYNYSHPVSVAVGTREEIEEIFDLISYKKGSILVNMMFHYLGEETFKKGIIRYLEENKYQNVEQDDLFTSLEIEIKKARTFEYDFSFKSIMHSWTLQAGYPVITVNRNYEDNSIEIHQERFYVELGILPTNECWWIPLTYTNQQEKDFKNTRPKDWLSCPSSEPKVIKNILCNKKEWVIFNIGMIGLYRVNYDEHNWEMLMSTLNSDSYKDISAFNRFQLIEDSAALAASNRLSYKIFFGILQYLDRETDHLPWIAVNTKSQFLKVIIRDTPQFQSFHDFMKRLLQPIAKKIKELNVDLEAPGGLNKMTLKRMVLATACMFNLEECERDEYVLPTSQKLRKNTIPPDLRSIVYCNKMKKASEEEWNDLWERLKKKDAIGEQQDILESLGCTRSTSLLQSYLDLILDEQSGLRQEDKLTVFSAVAKNDVGYKIAKTFFQNNVQKIFESLKPNVEQISIYLLVISKYVTTEEEYDEFRKFVEENDEIFSISKNKVEQALERARYHIEWRKLHLHRIEQFLKKP